MGQDGIGPSTSFLSGKRSTNELLTPHCNYPIYQLSNNPIIKSTNEYFEVRAGIEPAHSCFADSRVTSSPTHHFLPEFLGHTAAFPLRHRAIIVFYHSLPYLFYAHKFPLE